MSFKHLGVMIGLAAFLTAPAFAQTEADSKVLPKSAFCPIDGKTITPKADTLMFWVNGKQKFFCSAACRDKFVQRPESYVKDTVYCTVQNWFKGFVQPGRRAEVNNCLYYLCCEPCVGWMRDKPWLYLKEAQDPVSHKWFKVVEDNPRSSIAAQVFLFESAETKAQFDKEPGKFVVPFRK